MKWRPAVGAAAEPGSLGVDGLVALGVVERLRDVRRQRRLAGRLAVEADEPAPAPEVLDELDGARAASRPQALASGGRAPPTGRPRPARGAAPRPPRRSRRRTPSRAGTTRVSFTTTSVPLRELLGQVAERGGGAPRLWPGRRRAAASRRGARAGAGRSAPAAGRSRARRFSCDPTPRVESPPVERDAVERARARIAEAREGGPTRADLEAALERARERARRLRTDRGGARERRSGASRRAVAGGHARGGAAGRAPPRRGARPVGPDDPPPRSARRPTSPPSGGRASRISPLLVDLDRLRLARRRAAARPARAHRSTASSAPSRSAPAPRSTGIDSRQAPVRSATAERAGRRSSNREPRPTTESSSSRRRARARARGRSRARARCPAPFSDQNGRKMRSRSLGRDPGPESVTDDRRRAVRRFERERDPAAVGRPGERVRRAGWRRSGGRGRRRCSAPGGAERRARSGSPGGAPPRRSAVGLLEQPAEVDLLVDEGEAVRLELGEVEQVADEAREPVGLRADDLERSVARAPRRPTRPSRSASTWPRMAVSGVRSSWETRHEEVPLVLLRLREPLGHLAEPLGEVRDLVARARLGELDAVAPLRDLVRGRARARAAACVSRAGQVPDEQPTATAGLPRNASASRCDERPSSARCSSARGFATTIAPKVSPPSLIG